jgi:PAS domain S-box-containing protein
VRQYGYSRGEFLAMTIKDIRPAKDIPRLLENVAQVGDGVDAAGIWRHRTKDGRLLDVEIVSHALQFAGHNAEMVLAHDVTARKQAEDALRQRNAELERFNRATVDREMAMIDLKRQINTLSQELGRPPPHELGFLNDAHSGEDPCKP